MALVFGLILVALVVVGTPMLCRAALRGMGESKGLQDWIKEGAPRLPFLERDESEDKTDA